MYDAPVRREGGKGGTVDTKILTPNYPGPRIRKCYDWILVAAGFEIPSTAVTTSDASSGIFVARSSNGEVAWLKSDRRQGSDSASQCVQKMGVQRSEVQFVEMLVLRRGFKYAWKDITQGEQVPNGAVATKWSLDGSVYVACDVRQQVGKCVMQRERANGVSIDVAGPKKQGRILVIEADHYPKLEVNIVSCENVQHQEYRVGQLANGMLQAVNLKKRKLFVEVEFKGMKEETKVQEIDGAQVSMFEEACRFDFEPDDVDNQELVLRVRETHVTQSPETLGECMFYARECHNQQHQLQFRSRKGATIPNGTVCVHIQHVDVEFKDDTLHLIPPVAVDFELAEEDLLGRLREHAPAADSTFEVCLRALQFAQARQDEATAIPSIPGEALLVVLSSGYLANLECFDKGALFAFASSAVTNVNQHTKAFNDLFFLSSSAPPFWKAEELDDFIQTHPNESLAASLLTHDLIGQPKRGATWLSADGTILAAAAQFPSDMCCPYRIVGQGESQLILSQFESEELSLDSSHVLDLYLSSAVGIACWLNLSGMSGVVFARGERGRLHVFLAAANSEPRGYCLKA
jgi:hypothetical protein